MRPLRQQAGVHHRAAALGVHHRPRAQPVDQLVAHRARSSTSSKRVVLARSLEALELREQVQVVVAEHRDRALAEIAHEAQHLERFRPAVDQVAHEPQAVARAIEADLRAAAPAARRSSPARRRSRTSPSRGDYSSRGFSPRSGWRTSRRRGLAPGRSNVVAGHRGDLEHDVEDVVLDDAEGEQRDAASTFFTFSQRRTEG